jgi:hypothetical protein
LTVWDWLHGTLRLNVRQNHLTLGVAAFPDAKELTYPKLMEMPFQEQQCYPPRLRPDDTAPHREETLPANRETPVPEAEKDLPQSSKRRI